MLRSRVESLTLIQSFTKAKIFKTAGLGGLIRSQYLSFTPSKWRQEMRAMSDDHKSSSQNGGCVCPSLRLDFSHQVRWNQEKKDSTPPSGPCSFGGWVLSIPREDRASMGLGSCPKISALKAFQWNDTRYTLLVVQMVKNLPAMQEAWVWCLGQEDALEKGVATHSSIP